VKFGPQTPLQVYIKVGYHGFLLKVVPETFQPHSCPSTCAFAKGII